MTKKVFELAKEWDLGAIDLVEKLKSIGMDVRNHMVSLTPEQIDTARKALYPQVASKSTEGATKKVVRKVVRKKTEEKEIEAPVEVKLQEPAPSPVIAEESNDQETEVKIEEEKIVEPVVVKEVVAASKNTILKKKDTIDDRPRGLKIVSMPEKKEEAPRNIAAAEQSPTASVSKSESEEPVKKKEFYKEKLHSFTPIFIPEAKPETAKRNPLDTHSFAPVTTVDSESEDSDEDKKDKKKRLGNLATLMSKKVVKKDITMLRADEEMKLATTIVGAATLYAPAKRKKIFVGEGKKTLITELKENKKYINVFDGCTASDLAQKLSIKFETFVNDLLKLNLLVKAEDYLGMGLVNEISSFYGFRVENKAFKEDEVLKVETKVTSDLPLRNPIITVMGHVDHGKTTLLDYIRNAKVVSSEAGGITQHIGAYSVEVNGATITFLDTPGHAAFANMRQRGANLTDIVVLVVAADDGVMPQTKESIKFIQNAKVPVIVAINKMDKEGVNPDKIKQELMGYGLVAEEWGGETQFIPVSALKGTGVDNLLEAIQLQAEMMELKASPKGAAQGVIIESKIEQGRGPVATILVQSGMLNQGDSLVVGETYGRARSLVDYTGKALKSAGPSTPVQVLGLDGIASPGDTIYVVKNDREAKKVVENRILERKKLESAGKKKLSLEDFFGASDKSEKKILPLIIRADVLGSYEAIKDALESFANSEVGVNVIGGGVGAITDSDVQQAESSKGFIIGFNMRPVTTARKLAEQYGVDIKTYSIIYEVINDVKLALEGLLAPEKTEVYVGRAQVRETFNIPKIGLIAGSVVIDGRIERGCNIRLLRDQKIVFDGKLSSLKRFKDDVKEVKNTFECGIALENFNDVRVDDIFEAYKMEETKRKLESVPGSAVL